MIKTHVLNTRFEMKPTTIKDTRDRLLEAAAELFAQRGYHASTLRDIAARGNVNVAAGHYHYGSKEALYIEVLREQFAHLRSRMQEFGATWSREELQHLSREKLTELLRLRTRTMLDFLLGPPPSLHGTLIQRELCDPSEALPIIIDELIEPMISDLKDIITLLEPSLDSEAVESCACSIIGQTLFYRTVMAAMLYRKKWEQYPKQFTARTAEHIVEFSLGGLTHLAAEQRKKRHGR